MLVKRKTVQIRLLGGFHFLYNGNPLTSRLTPRLQSLIAYLLLHRQEPISRQQLAYLFWPDSSDSQARTNLRHMLHALRNTLPEGEQWIKFDLQTVQWQMNDQTLLDAAAFELGAAQTESVHALKVAVQWYGGDLLPGCYEDWIAPERERLHAMLIGALEKLTLLLETERDYDGAIRYARQLLQHDPPHEATYRRLMRLHSLNGDRAGALRVYHACSTTLQRELNVEPGPETQKAYRRLMEL